jgi:tetratricopeptide (TPR) repeat protein
MGVAYLRLKKYKEALEAFESAISIEPWDMAAYVNAAIISEELGMKDKAIKYWQKYDRLLPVNKRKKEIQERLKKLGVKPAPAAQASPVSSTVKALPSPENKKNAQKQDKEVKK